MIFSIEWTLTGLWVLTFIALAVHHLMVKDMMRYELKKLEDRLRNPQEDANKAIGKFLDKHKNLLRK